MKVLLRIFLVCAGLFLVCVLGVTACVIAVDRGEWPVGNFSGNWSGKAERSETHGLELASGGLLEVKLGNGGVRVRSGQVDRPQVVANITAYGKNDEHARAILDRTKLDLSLTENGVSIASHVEDALNNEPKPKLDLEIVVPAQVRLAIETGSGGIHAEGDGFGDSRLESSYGSVQIAHVTGELSAKSNSGKVDAQDVRGQRCEIHSGYGALSLARIEVDELKAKTQSGSVKGAGLRAKTISLESGYGALELSDVEGQLTAKSSSGHVRAEKLRGGSYSLSSSYGTVNVKDAVGKLEARSSSGSIELSDIDGGVVADTKYGNVRIDGKLTGMEAQSSSGGVSIAALEGSVLESDWKASSSYGPIRCDLPRDLAFDLTAKTGYGSIDLGFEIAVAAGGLKSGKELHGKINGGGHRFDVSTSSGSISIQPREH